MSEIILSVEDKPAKEDIEDFWNILRAYNHDQVGSSPHKELTILLRDTSGCVVGGLNGLTYFGWLCVDNLAVDESLRHQGFGTKLLKAAELEAVKRGCKNAWLDTYSFQAREFYEKQGYGVFADLDDYPQGHKRYFLKKALV